MPGAAVPICPQRLLYRLSLTAHRDRFVLKGAMLMTSWFKDPLRPTQDLDLLGFGDPDADAMVAIFRAVCAVPIDDGVAFDVPGFWSSTSVMRWDMAVCA